MPRILIVEDNRDAREMMATLLRGDDREIVQAADGKDALERCAEVTPRVAIVDIFMPVMDGVELMHVLRARYPKTRIIAISAGWNVPNLTVTEAIEDPLLTAARLGADLVLPKPVDTRALRDAVATLLADEP
jgi:CheY-like chemotaxis protein